MAKLKCVILIDGSNFYFKLKKLDLHNLLEFNFTKFSKLLARSANVVGITYYIGKIRQDGNKKSDKLLAAQQKLFLTFAN